MVAATGSAGRPASYVDVRRLFARGEQMTLCKAMLADRPKSAEQRAPHVVAAKGLDADDKAPARAMTGGATHALRQQWRRGLIAGAGEIKSARVWGAASWRLFADLLQRAADFDELAA